MFDFLSSKWYIVYKPNSEKVYIVKSFIEPNNTYFEGSTGIILSGGPYDTREDAEKDLPKIKKELNV